MGGSADRESDTVVVDRAVSEPSVTDNVASSVRFVSVTATVREAVTVTEWEPNSGVSLHVALPVRMGVATFVGFVSVAARVREADAVTECEPPSGVVLHVALSVRGGMYFGQFERCGPSGIVVAFAQFHALDVLTGGSAAVETLRQLYHSHIRKHVQGHGRTHSALTPTVPVHVGLQVPSSAMCGMALGHPRGRVPTRWLAYSESSFSDVIPDHRSGRVPMS